MRAVVLGGSGFLGLNIIEALTASGHEVSATRRRSSNTIFLRRLKVPMCMASLEDTDSLVAAMDGTEVAFFASAPYPRYSIDTPAQVERATAAANNVISAARRAGVSRLIYTGSVATIARPATDRPACEADGIAELPAGSTYVAVKNAVEQTMLAAAGAGPEIVILCPSGCLGPYDHKVATGFFVVGLATRSLSVYTDGRINIVDARDVARAHVRAAESGRSGERYILGGHNITVEELLRTITRLFGAQMPERRLEAEEAIAFATAEETRCHCQGKGRPALFRETVDMIVHGQWIDSSKAERELGFASRALEETLWTSYRWYVDNGYIAKK